ncbi:MAG: RNA pseudouridine synthase, partial [Bacteroidales bacterium]|nr:RNA pseudouridine synthase [Bacteroidales bacterium]
MTTDEKFHRFNRAVASDELPPHFTYPFCYTPHPLCMEAAEQLKQHLSSQDNLLAELNEGKMLGVLVVEDPHGEIGFLAAFSGNLAHSNNLPYFVPAVYDLLDPDGEFCQGERAISAINHRIAAMQRDEHFAAVKQQY